MKIFGFPEKVQTDQGKEFTGEFAKQFFQYASEKFQSTAYHPQSQGVVERFNRTLTDMLAKLVKEEQRDWINHLDRIQLEYNGCVHRITGFSPYFLVFGQPMSMSIDVMLGKNKKELEKWKELKRVGKVDTTLDTLDSCGTYT